MNTSRDVIDGLIRNEPVNRIGLYDAPWPDALTKWADEQGYPKNEEGKPMSAVEHFGFDMECCGGWFDNLPIRGYKEVLEETDEWIVERNGAGAAIKVWKHKSGAPHREDVRMTSREIWERDYRSHLLYLDKERLKLDIERESLQRCRAGGKWTYYGTPFVFELMRSSMGDVCMYESLLLDPDWIHDYNRVYTDFFKMHYKCLIEEAGKPDGVWLYEDLGFNKGLLCSPEALGELIFPYYRELIDFFHGYDLPVVLHSCGNICEAMDLVVDAGFDALNPMEAKAGCDVVTLAQKYGHRLAFVGGFDARVLETGDRQAIRDEVSRLCTTLKSTGTRYVFGSDHSLSTRVNLDDFQYAIDVYKEHMMY